MDIGPDSQNWYDVAKEVGEEARSEAVLQGVRHSCRCFADCILIFRASCWSGPVHSGPVPKVDSLVLKFRVSRYPEVDVGDEMFFRTVVKGAFAKRRKTLWNCIRSAFPYINEKTLDLVFRQLRH